MAARAGARIFGSIRTARRRARSPAPALGAIEAIFKFETAEGRGSGVLRLTPDAGGGDTLKAWTLLTALDELKGFEETVGRARPDGAAYSRDFRGPNWLDLRKAAAVYSRPRSGGADRRRRTGRACGRGAASAIAGRCADRRSREAHRRQLAQPLSRAGAAQPGAGQSLPLHAVPAELADLHSQGQARRLDGGLCRGDGVELLDRARNSKAAATTTRPAAGPRCCAAPTAASGPCIRGTS